tara:strand:- start:1801 stop:2040 length:240 start_codon:yes stop_codon:yes gene_type:complete
LFCSHNPRLTDGRQKLEEKLHYLEDFNGKVIQLYQKGLNAREIDKTMKLREHGFIHLLSLGYLSRLNMVRSAIRDYESK